MGKHFVTIKFRKSGQQTVFLLLPSFFSCLLFVFVTSFLDFVNQPVQYCGKLEMELVVRLVFVCCLLNVFAGAYSVNKVPKPKVVLITGCSSGIGKSAVEEFIKHPGFKVWATMRNPQQSTLAPSEDGRLVVAQMDVTSDESVNTLVNRIIAEDGKIDVVINNAGYGMAGCLETVKIEEAMKVFDVNVWGVVRVLQAVLPHMRKKKSGYVINISSTSGIRGIPCLEYYTGSKFALEGITDSMRYSLSAFNISVTNVNAGPVRTSFTDKFGKVESGGRGTRAIKDANSDYLQVLTSGMVAGLNHRMQTEEAQTSEDLAHVLVNLVNLKQQSKRITDIPFNIGSNKDSQNLIEQVRKQPTGWGGIYNDILKVVPNLDATLQSVKLHQKKKDHQEL